MTNQELIEMLKNMNKHQQDMIADFRVELEEAQAVNRLGKSTQRVLTNALGVAKGGLQVRKETQSDFEMLRLALQGLLAVFPNPCGVGMDAPQQYKAIEFAHKILTLTEKEQF
jgi:hypothetical protein